jgi:hypothetical protein
MIKTYEYTIWKLPDGYFKWFVMGASGIEKTEELAHKCAVAAIEALLEERK